MYLRCGRGKRMGMYLARSINHSGVGGVFHQEATGVGSDWVPLQKLLT